MSIIIKGMDMPKSCEECKWHIDFYIVEEQVGGLCTITEKDDKEKACPLIEIPTPHGRLIDWDAFNNKLEIQYAEGRGKSLAPTILEKEG